MSQHLKTITPMILGHGRSGDAIAKSLACLALQKPDLPLAPSVWLARGADLKEERAKSPSAILCIANPHGLHAGAILAADQAGFDGILCEKPACVNLEQLQKLRNVKTPTAVFHGYRQMWGPQMLKQMLDQGQFGELIAIEGRYWQASVAERAVSSEMALAKTWKDDVTLSGEFDTYLDLGTHWLDAVCFLHGSLPSRIQGWRSYVNAPSAYRDSHIQVALDFRNGARAFGSISKTVHGSGNHFELNLIGSKLSATWEFLNPDEIVIGQGRERKTISRKNMDLGSRQSAYHGMGWLEGYIEIGSRLLTEVFEKQRANYPRLAENLDLLEAMLCTEWP